MEPNLQIDVAALDERQRRALEDVIGSHLAENQRLIIRVTEIASVQSEQPSPVQSLEDWAKIYDGLSESEIDSIDKIANSRSNLTRDLP